MDDVTAVYKDQWCESSWDAEFEGFEGSYCMSEGPRLIFGTSRELAASIQRSPGHAGLMPPEFVRVMLKDLNGHYGSYQDQSTTGVWYVFKIKQVSAFEATGQIAYTWYQIAAFFRCNLDTKSIWILCFDCPPSVQIQLRTRLLQARQDASTWHSMFIEVVKDLYDVSVWALRDHIRNIEQARASHPDFVHLHELARHMIHSNETLDVAMDTVRTIHESCRDGDLATLVRCLDDAAPLNRMLALEKEFRGIKRRSESLKERLTNEINLAFNLVAQRDSRVTHQLGEDSRKDSVNMRSIAVFGLAYLPGTFISGIFGMNFFQFNTEEGKQTWVVSEMFWLYWVVTVPLTLATILCWMSSTRGERIKKCAMDLRRLLVD